MEEHEIMMALESLTKELVKIPNFEEFSIEEYQKGKFCYRISLTTGDFATMFFTSNMVTIMKDWQKFITRGK